MPADETRKMTPQTIGAGVHDPRQFRHFSKEDASVVVMYEDADQTLVVWNLEPGQENSPHVHPSNAHTMMVLEGEGVVLRKDGTEAPLKAGQCVIIPRGVMHGIRNTGRERLSYFAVTTNGPDGYIKQNLAGERAGNH
ncbi:MAG: cupin domain-containing protein [Candidatus Binataceae bacterium]